MAKLLISRGFRGLIFFLLFATIGAQNDHLDSRISWDCITPKEQSGECISILQCKELLNMLTTRPLMPQTIRFLRSSQCGIRAKMGDANVCCPKLGYIKQNGTTNITDHNTTNELTTPSPMIAENSKLPSDCGSDLAMKIIHGEGVANLSEFPWMALLEYTEPRETVTTCGGVLVSERYVLTAAHCVKNKTYLSSVRLGEYDTLTPLDCLPDGQGGEICADPAVSIPIEESIIHESYRPTFWDRHHDIALLRLSRRVSFTGYIKPICLPSTVEVPGKLWVAGWGKTENSSRSNVKLKLYISLADPIACSDTYRKGGVGLGPSQLCAGVESGKDVCQGDSGGPLMSTGQMLDGQQKWMVVGVVSFGSIPCGQENWPSVYTKVIDYIPWILRKLRD